MEAAKTMPTHVTMSNGLKMPMFGLGTYAISDPEVMKYAVTELGYRSYDTASFYKNEEVVGEACSGVVAGGTIKREDLFIISKVWWDEVADVAAACERSLKKLQVDYLDLYLVHWPMAIKVEGEGDNKKHVNAKVPMYKVWAQMEALVDKGLVKSIGVSNFNVQSLWDMLSYARIPPVVNEIELHPLCVQDQLVNYMKENKIHPIGYCPVARGADNAKCPNVCEHQVVKKCQEKYGKTGAQILLNWGMARGHIVIPKSGNKDRMKENIDSCSFTMEQAEIDAITNLAKGEPPTRICDAGQWIGTSIFA